ncbi:tetrathionate reductase family octaheme c-type cytochrome [Acidobacteriota bacterium]
MSDSPEPVRKPFFTTGVFLLLSLMAGGVAFALGRFFLGLGSVTNLDTQHPWGIWIGIDVASGVALASGGFTTAALVHIAGRQRFHALLRPALLTAWLGYSFVAIALLVDLGRYYNIWHPLVYWQGNSVLFEVGMCVMAYLLVLTVEFSPTIIEGLLRRIENGGLWVRLLNRIKGPMTWLHKHLHRVMWLFILAGVVLSCMHQSSLGSLMVIAPTKLNPLWYTPILPLLFLSSAIAVGFPMVVFESMIVSKSLNRKIEIDLLSQLARYVPFFIGIYAAIKFGDLLVRKPPFGFETHPADAVSFLVEIIFGVVLPLILFLIPQVRRSPKGLFTASTLIVLGVLLNRVNVFLVGYHPPFAVRSYFPSIAEIAVTVAIIATIVFLYRLFATFFPVLTTPPETTPLHKLNAISKPIPFAMFFFLIFLSTFSPSLAEEHVSGGEPSEASQTESPGFRLSDAPQVMIIENSIVNKLTDEYKPVRFYHRAHAIIVQGTCTVCHHRVPGIEEDRVGVKICRKDMTFNRPNRCSQCHGLPNESDQRQRPGMKGALHRRCIDCHQREAEGPTECSSCHHPRVPNHRDKLKLTEPVEPQQVTRRCLECHEKEGWDILASAHWTWEGLSPDTFGNEPQRRLGKRFVINNYCINVRSNLARCANCHVGYGWQDDSFDFSNAENIDCLICHDTTGTYKKDPISAGMPKSEVDLIKVAESVGRPSRMTCGACHFYGGGGDNVKHGDLSSELDYPRPEFDVHMGRHNFLCQDCHATRDHRIAGGCLAIPAREGRIMCSDCHTERPHATSAEGLLTHHLDNHSKHIACQTCHIPSFAKTKPTKIHWDWSQAGQDREESKDEYGMPTFSKKKGAFRWDLNVRPTYAWYNGKHERYLLGDPVNIEDCTSLNYPLGSIEDPSAKIFPFKIHTALQPADLENKYLVVPNLWGGFWKHFDWERAIADGMRSLGLPYSGTSKFIETRMYTTLNHEVVPKEKALSCDECHFPEKVSCTRCHRNDPKADLKKFSRWAESQSIKSHERSQRFDLRALGYQGDPIDKGGRFSLLPLKR